MRRTYSELVQLPTFTERLRYLLLDGTVAVPTFGANRYLNQKLYRSADWQRVRRLVIIRDGGNDLGVEGYSIEGAILIHHINPITEEMILNADPEIFNLDNLILTTRNTHNIIHYGDAGLIKEDWKPRTPNDTIPWR
jgi:hypothetical protein